MRERPILFSAPMVRAILEGRKTQTRRMLKPFPTAQLPLDEKGFSLSALDEHGCGALVKDHGMGVSIIPLPRSPYGVRGDRLWVKETWARRLDEDYVKPSDLKGDWAWYWADPQTCNTGCAGAAGKRRPSIFMQRRFSRITLEITDIRAQRLGDLTEEDAKAEGMIFHDGRPSGHHGWRHDPGYGFVEGTPRGAFFALWRLINGADSLKSNPWVWAISFRRVER